MPIPAPTRHRIRAVRKALSLSQEQFAHLLGVTWTTVSRWESGSSSPTGMPLRLIYELENAATQPEFQAALRDPRAADPLFLIHCLLHGRYATPPKGSRIHG